MQFLIIAAVLVVLFTVAALVFTLRAVRWGGFKLPAQEPEPLAHGPPHEIELLDQTA